MHAKFLPLRLPQLHGGGMHINELFQKLLSAAHLNRFITPLKERSRAVILLIKIGCIPSHLLHKGGNSALYDFTQDEMKVGRHERKRKNINQPWQFLCALFT